MKNNNQQRSAVLGAVLALSLSGLSPVMARGLDVSISGETVQMGLFSQTAKLVQGGADVGASLLLNDASDAVLSGTILAIGEPPRQGAPYQFGIGAKAYLADLDVGENMAGVGIGGRVTFVVPNGVSPVGLVLEGYIAPGITAFGDADQITDLAARIEIEVTPSASGYVGVRSLEVDFPDKTVTIDDNVHVGVRINF